MPFDHAFVHLDVCYLQMVDMICNIEHTQDADGSRLSVSNELVCSHALEEAKKVIVGLTFSAWPSRSW